MHTVLVILFIIIFILFEILLFIGGFAVGMFMPCAIYSDPELQDLWKNGYMLIAKDMKKYYAANKSFKGYDFSKAIKTYLIDNINKVEEDFKDKSENK